MTKSRYGPALTIMFLIHFVCAGHVPAQEMVDIGGRALELLRLGSGSPAIVFESALTNDLTQWRTLQPRLAELTTTVSYSRAGRGGSPATSTLRDPGVIARELRTLLRAAGIQPPYVLVGASVGALYTRAYAQLFPSEVVGIVLSDGTHERQRIEFTKLGDPPALPTDLDGPATAEFEGILKILEMGQLGVTGKLPDVPMAILTSVRVTEGSDASQTLAGREAWRALHNEIFQATTYGMHIVTRQSGHPIHAHEPDLLENAIRWVVQAARLGK